MYSPQAGIDGGVQLQAAGLGLSHSQEWAGATPIAPHPPSNLPTLTAEKQEPEPVRKQLGPTRRVKVALKASLSSPGPRFPLLITSLSSRVTTSSNEPLSTFLTFRPVPFALSPYLLFVKTLFSVHASGEKTAYLITRRASVRVPFALACCSCPCPFSQPPFFVRGGSACFLRHLCSIFLSLRGRALPLRYPVLLLRPASLPHFFCRGSFQISFGSTSCLV